MLSMPEEFTAGIIECLDEQGRFRFSRWGGEGMTKMSPLWLLKYLPNMPASHLAIYNDLRGPNNSLTMREAAANAALGEAFHIILRGSAETDAGRGHRHPLAPDEDGPYRAAGGSQPGRRRSGGGQPALRSRPQRHGARRRGRRHRAGRA